MATAAAGRARPAWRSPRPGLNSLRGSAFALGALLAGCTATAPAPAPQDAPEAAAAAQPEPVAEPPAAAEGLPPAPALPVVAQYRCELERSVFVRQVSPDVSTIVIGWLGRNYTLAARPTSTGALRFEDAKAGLVWLVISGKSMLLDSRSGRQLANECRP